MWNLTRPKYINSDDFLNFSVNFPTRYNGFQWLTQLDPTKIHQIRQKFIKLDKFSARIGKNLSQIQWDLHQISLDLGRIWRDLARSKEMLASRCFLVSPKTDHHPTKPELTKSILVSYRFGSSPTNLIKSIGHKPEPTYGQP